jgi:hypothetical protein
MSAVRTRSRPRNRQMTKLALYFGYGAGGHFLRGNGRRDSLVPKRDYPGFPWTISHLDTGLLRNGKIPDKPDGRIFWTCVGSDVATDLWYAFYWWDRSGDSRPGSNSGVLRSRIFRKRNISCVIFRVRGVARNHRAPSVPVDSSQPFRYPITEIIYS